MIKDVSDFFAAGATADDLQSLADGATASDSPEGSADNIIEHPDPIPLAEHYLARGRQRRLVRWRGEFYEHTGTHYRAVSDEAIDTALYRHLDQLRTRDRETGGLKKIVPRQNLVREVRSALPSREQVLLADHVDDPTWLDGSVQLPPGEVVSCSNGILHLPSRVLHPPTDKLFALNAVDYEYIRDAPRPLVWEQFLRDLFDADEESIGVLQELFGYYLTRDTRQQKIGLIVGPQRSGKGTIGRVLTAMLGQANVCGPTLASLGMNFGLSPLLGKLLAIVSDARLSGRSDQAVITERLLSISGEDSITVDRKYLTPWTGRLSTRFLILTNELPRLTDASGALANRFIVLRLKKSWLGKEKHDLTDKLLKELPGILLWAIEGWRRLRERGYFVQPQASMAAMQQLEDLASPMKVFLRDKCHVGPEYSCPAQRLFDAWNMWCKSSGREHGGTIQAFGRDLWAAVPGLDDRQPSLNGVRYREYVGVALTAEAASELDDRPPPTSPWSQ